MADKFFNPDVEVVDMGSFGVQDLIRNYAISVKTKDKIRC